MKKTTPSTQKLRVKGAYFHLFYTHVCREKFTAQLLIVSNPNALPVLHRKDNDHFEGS